MKLAASTTGGGGAGLLVVWLLGHFGVTLGAEEGYGLACLTFAAGATIWHRGVTGVIRQIWRGDRG